MSDYGSMLHLTKKDKSPLTDAEKELISQSLGKIKSENDFSDVLGEDFIFKTIPVHNEKDRLVIILSEYWDEGGDDNFEFAKENDIDQAESVAEKLTETLGQTFEIKASFENW
jgi:hypothetical protein